MQRATGPSRKSVVLAFLAACFFAVSAIIEAFSVAPMHYVAFVQAAVAALWFFIAFRWNRQRER